ncbi:MAG: chromate transporter [Ruminococcaceae bacterium]|nr:chromate transporter [Oscillospiraceae bacterium]
MKELFNLFGLFFKIGIMTFGGGYAMLPILERELAEKRNYVTMDEIMDYFAVGQCTPGIIAVNTATFIGFKRKGILGGIFATIGVVTPSLIIITLLATVLGFVAGNEIVKNAFAGVSVAVCALIVQAILKLVKSGIKDAFTVGIALASFLASFFLDASPIIVIIVAAIVGVLAKYFLDKIQDKKKVKEAVK